MDVHQHTDELVDSVKECVIGFSWWQFLRPALLLPCSLEDAGAATADVAWNPLVTTGLYTLMNA
jgi:hypothetical protein